FTGATSISFGDVAASSFTVSSDDSITATVPSQALGTVDVTVTTPDGQSWVSPAEDEFSYINDAPVGANHTLTTLANTAYTFATTDFGFSEPADWLTNSFQAVEVTALPTFGTLTDNSVAVSAGQFVSVSDIDAGWLVYTPGSAGGASGDSFTFQVQDDRGTAN